MYHLDRGPDLSGDPKIGIAIMTNSLHGESIYKELLETLLKNPYTPIEWEGFTPYNQAH